MPEKYFEKFNVISYANTAAVNLMQRTSMLTSVMQNPYIFYPFDINNNQRPDQLSDAYYNDQYMSWILYMSNGIVDPYYDWYLSEDEFHQYLMKKYKVETIYELQRIIKFYRNNWPDAETVTPIVYEALEKKLQKYWEPVYNGSYRPIYYQRVKEDWTVSTNNMVNYFGQFGIRDEYGNVTNIFQKGEFITIIFNDVGYHKGYGQVAVSTAEYVTVQHTTGFMTKEETGIDYVFPQITGNNSDIICNIDSIKPILIDKGNGSLERIISLDEQIYWSPVSVYDYEYEKNEKNKSIRVLNASYAPQIANELKGLLE